MHSAAYGESRQKTRVGFMLLVCALSLVFFWPAVEIVLSRWLNFAGGYSHGFLVLALVGHALWEDRHELFVDPDDKPVTWFWLTALSGMSFVWMIAWAGALSMPQVLLLAGMIVAQVGALFGLRRIFKLLPYLFVLAFALPIWDPLSPHLQYLAVDASKFILDYLTPLTVYVDQTFIFTPTMTFEVAPSCSGLGLLIVTLCLLSYVGLMNRPKLWVSVALLAIGVGLGLIINWIRIVLIVMIGDAYGPENFIIKDHVWFGWVVFLVIGVPVFLLLLKLVPQAQTSTQEQTDVNKATPAAKLGIVAASFLIPMVGYTLAQGAKVEIAEDSVAQAHQLNAGQVASGVSTIRIDELPWAPSYENATSQQAYQLNATQTERPGEFFYFARFAEQTPFSELVSRDNQITQDSWQHTTTQTVLAGQANLEVRRNRVLSDDVVAETLVLSYWYDIGGAVALTQMDAKLLQIVKKFDRRTDATVFILGGLCRQKQECDALREQILHLTKEYQSLMYSALQG